MGANNSTMISVGPRITRFVTFGDNELSGLYQQKLNRSKQGCMIASSLKVTLKLWLHRGDVGHDRPIRQTRMDLFHHFLHLNRNFIFQIMKGSIAYIPRVVATWEAAIPGKFDQLKDAGSNKL